MNILIKKHDSVEGPYSLQVIKDGLKSCRFRLDDMACKVGDNEWVPLYTLSSQEVPEEEPVNEQPAPQQPPRQSKREKILSGTESLLSANSLIESAVDGLENSLTKLLADDQKPGEVKKIMERAQELLTPNENVDYIGIQKKPAINLFPDSIILTNKRLLIMRPAAFIGMNFEDYLWKEVADVHMSEQIITATITCTTITGHVMKIDFIPKKQARKIYTYAQDIEERMHEYRRYRMMEERRADAGGLVLQSNMSGSHPQPTGIPAHVDPQSTQSTPQIANNAQEEMMKTLQNLKQMLDAGLIDESEYDMKKKEVLSRM